MHPLRSRAALFAAASTLGALAIPAAAHATVTSTPDAGAKTLLVSSDQAADAIALTVNAGGNYAVNGTDTGLAAAADIAITVDAGAGSDTVDATALTATQYGDLTIKGGDGDDLLTGGIKGDHLFGDDGNDRIIGFRGNDDQHGGAGNDTLVWNNGDGTDTSDGEAGADDVEFNGAATQGDALTIKPGAVAGHVQFDRTNLVAIGIDMSNTEHLTVNGLGGDDTVAGSPGVAARLAFGTALNGGTGNDVITGTDANDVIGGGEGDDVLNGAAGDDRITGDHGNDTMNGGDGDDTAIWANGDGNDVTNGDAGLDTTQIDEGAAADIMSVRPDGARSHFDRTNAPFSMDMDTEVLLIHSFAGDDNLTVAPGLGSRLSVVVDAGAGNDTLQGADEVDTFFGGSGDDQLTGGLGADLLDGQDGNDTLLARDGIAEGVRGGAGTDTAQADARDAVDGVENLDQPAVAQGDVKALAATVRTRKVTLTRRNGKLVAKLSVACPAGEAGGCRATVQLTTAKAVKLGSVKLIALLGTQKVSLKGGQTKTVTFKLTGGVAKLASHGKLAARASVVSQDAAGNVATSSRSVSLVLPRRK
jgi:Ca2+-binding RTX toxin-like protein